MKHVFLQYILMKKYLTPEIHIIKLNESLMSSCSCAGNCIGTECNCGCKGWTEDSLDEENF